MIIEHSGKKYRLKCGKVVCTAQTEDGLLVLRKSDGTVKLIEKQLPPCQHLGPPITRDGISVKVKCNCANKQETEQFHTAHVCEVHKRCLPSLVPAESWYEREESKLYHACHGCKERELCQS